MPTRVGKRKKKMKGPDAANKLPQGKRLKKYNLIDLINIGNLFIY